MRYRIQCGLIVNKEGKDGLSGHFVGFECYEQLVIVLWALLAVDLLDTSCL